MTVDETKLKQLAGVVTNLSAEDSDTRRWAVYDLESYPPKLTVDHLVAGIQDEHRAVREAASEVLESVPTELSLPQLTPLLGSSQIEVRNIVATLIAKFGDAAVDYLVEALVHENEDVRKFSADILGLAESDQAVESLAKALYDSVENVGVSAAEALGKIKSPQALPCLTKAFEDRDYLKRECAEAIGLVGQAEGAHFLMDRLLATQDLLIQFALVDALGNAGDAKVLDFLEVNFEALPDQLHVPAVMSMLRIANRVDIRLLMRPGTPVDTLVMAAMEADEEFQQLFIEQIDEELPTKVLARLVHAHGQLNSRVLVALIKATTPHAELRQFTLEMVEHKDDWVSYTAIEHLVDFELAAVKRVLKRVLAGDRNLPQLAAMKVVHQLGLPEGKDWIAPFLESVDEDLRAMAEQVLEG